MKNILISERLIFGEMENISIEQYFDILLYQLEKGITFENYIKGKVYLELQKFKPWKSRYKYKFDVYSNDHLIDGEKHFHFKNIPNNIDCKISFSGKILESNGKNELDSKLIKELKNFLLLENINIELNEMWNSKNPDLIIDNK